MKACGFSPEAWISHMVAYAFSRFRANLPPSNNPHVVRLASSRARRSASCSRVPAPAATPSLHSLPGTSRSTPASRSCAAGFPPRGKRTSLRQGSRADSPPTGHRWPSCGHLPGKYRGTGLPSDAAPGAPAAADAAQRPVAPPPPRGPPPPCAGWRKQNGSPSRSHSTLPGTAFSNRIHTSNISGVIL